MSTPVFNGTPGQGQANYDVKTSTTASGLIQHVRLDLGSGSSEAQAEGTIPAALTPPSDTSGANVDKLTAQYISPGRRGLDVNAAFTYEEVETLCQVDDVIGPEITSFGIGVKAGDLIDFTSGALITHPPIPVHSVISVSTSFLLAQTPDPLPSIGDSFRVLRWRQVETINGAFKSAVYDALGNAVDTATAVPTGTARGLVSRAFSYIYDALGNAIASATGAPATSDRGLVTRSFTYAEENTVQTGNITANGQTLAIALGRNNNVTFSVTGTYTSLNLAFEVSNDGGLTYPFAIQACRSDSNTIETTSGVISSVSRLWECSVNARTHFRVRATAFTSGTAAIRIMAGVSATEPIPAIATHAVTGTVAATQSGTWSTRTQDGTGNAIASAVALPGKADRGLTVRNIGVNSRLLGTDGALGEITIPRGYAYYTSRTTAAGCTTTAIVCTVDPSTQVQVGDFVLIATGTLAQGNNQKGYVSAVSVTTITIDTPAFSIAPAAGLSVEIYKSAFLQTDNRGRVATTIYSANNLPVYPVATNKTFFEAAEMDDATIAATLGTPAIVGSLGNSGSAISISNTTDVPLKFSIDSGATYQHIAPGQTMTFTFTDWGGYLSAGDDIYCTYTNATPTTGFFSYMMPYV